MTATKWASETLDSMWRRAKRFWTEDLGVTVSAVVLIGFLVVAVAAFGVIAAGVIEDAGEEIEDVDFDDTGG